MEDFNPEGGRIFSGALAPHAGVALTLDGRAIGAHNTGRHDQRDGHDYFHQRQGNCLSAEILHFRAREKCFFTVPEALCT